MHFFLLLEGNPLHHYLSCPIASNRRTDTSYILTPPQPCTIPWEHLHRPRCPARPLPCFRWQAYCCCVLLITLGFVTEEMKWHTTLLFASSFICFRNTTTHSAHYSAVHPHHGAQSMAAAYALGSVNHLLETAKWNEMFTNTRVTYFLTLLCSTIYALLPCYPVGYSYVVFIQMKRKSVKLEIPLVMVETTTIKKNCAIFSLSCTLLHLALIRIFTQIHRYTQNMKREFVKFKKLQLEIHLGMYLV